jgi:hypothetical protein
MLMAFRNADAKALEKSGCQGGKPKTKCKYMVTLGWMASDRSDVGGRWCDQTLILSFY